MSFQDPIPEKTICSKCKERIAKVIWSEGVMAAIHGAYTYYCLLCSLREQLKHAREQAAKVIDLECDIDLEIERLNSI